MQKREQKKRFRFSSIGRILVCPNSKWATGLKIESSNLYTRIGQAIHRFLFHCLLYNRDDTRFLYESANALKVELNDDLYRMAWNGLECLAFIKSKMTPVMAEESLFYEFDEWKGEGHPDLVGLPDGESYIAIADWKTGRPKEIHWDQLRMYGIAAKRHYGMPEKTPIKLILCYLRENHDEMIQIKDFESGEQIHFISKVKRTLKYYDYWSAQPDACAYCPHKPDCKVYKNTIRGTSGLIQSGQIETTDQMVEHYDDVKLLKSSCENFFSSLKARLEDNSVQSRDGHLFRLEDQTREVVIAEKALTFVAKRCKEKGIDYDEIFYELIKNTISKSNFKPIAKKLGFSYGELMENIRDSGGLKKNTITTIKKEKIDE